MEYLLPLLVVIPLGAAFLIPMLNMFVREDDAPFGRAIALLATGALVVIGLLILGDGRTISSWIGGHKGNADVLGIVARHVADDETGEGSPSGLLVEQVTPGSNAEAAGMRPGDIVSTWQRPGDPDFRYLTSMNQLRRLNATKERGTVVFMQLAWDGGMREVEVRAGKPVAGIAIFSDGLTRLMLLIITVVSFAAVLFSRSYMKRYTKVHLYYCPLMLMIAGMCGVVISGDLFNIYVFLEVAAVASYALVGFGVEGEELEASFKYLVLSAVASGFILIGIAIVYGISGTLNLAQIADFMTRVPSNDALWLAFGFFICGFGLKAAMVPFHAWLPDAHPSAPAPVSAMLSGLLIKASGVYVIARLVFNVIGVSVPVANVLIILGCASMLVGGLLMCGQWDLKRLLAYSSISHMGLVMLALGVGAEALARQQALSQRWSAIAFLAIFGGLFHLLNHAAFKSLLFLCSGSMVYGAGSRDLRELNGVGRKMPVTGLFVRIGALSISGVPPFSGFFSKMIIIIAVLWAGHWFLGLLAATGSLVTLLAFIKVQRHLLGAETAPQLAEVRESPSLMLVAMGILAAACVALGILLPLHMGGLISPAVRALAGQLTGYAAAVFGG